MPKRSCRNGLPDALEGFDGFVKREMKKWEVPGAAIGVVRGKRRIYQQGFGIRNARSGLEVNCDTLFSIASTTKAFTATAAGILVDEGKLKWDTPVCKYVPSFRLKDKVATERLTIRDMLCHRTGLPRHDMVWWKTDLSRAELFRRLRYLKPTKDIRAEWQYCNLMYVAAGVVIEEISGQSWEDFVRERIFEPLGMNDASFFPEAQQCSGNIAVGHRHVKNRFAVQRPNQVPSKGPAGTICANATDMCKWLIMNLHEGKYRGSQVISKRALREIHTPQIAAPGMPEDHELLPASYALGWNVSAYRGHLMVSHSGSINGTLTRASFLPRDGIGVFVVTNIAGPKGGYFLNTVRYRAFDTLLGLSTVPWSRRFRARHAKSVAQEKRQKRKSAPPKEKKPPSKRLAEYAGEYHEPAYGLLTVEHHRGALRMTFHGEAARLAHWDGDSFKKCRNAEGAPPHLTFRQNRPGDISAVAVKLGELDIVFRKR